MTNPAPIKRVVIAGGGTAGWMTAAALSRFLPHTTDIRLVESDAIGTIGVGEATIPPITDFNTMLGIDEDEFLRETGGSFKLGIEFNNWGNIGDSYFHPFGVHGYDIDGISFHQFWSRLRLAGDTQSLDEYTIAAHAARAARFIRPNTTDSRSPLSQMRHAYHIDATRYAAFLRRYAESNGAKRVEGRIVGVDRDSENGFLTNITLENGDTVPGDLFVDCTGFRALLIGEALGVEYEDWRHWLPCDRAIAIPSASHGEFIPYTKATALEAGWRWQIPLQHRVGNGHVYSSEYLGDDEAASRLLGELQSEALAEPNFLRFTTGRRREFWNKNCIAIGLSSGFLEPLESTSIHLIQEGVSKLLALFPDSGFDDIERDTYNELLGTTFEYVRDFIILHYHATQRDDTDFWNYVRTMDIPEKLAGNIDLFQRTGRFFAHRADLFTITSWVAVMAGQNILPAAYDPLVDRLPTDEIRATLKDMRDVYAEATRRMPPHQAFIDKFCKAEK
jgi:tryptophan halogenase